MTGVVPILSPRLAEVIDVVAIDTERLLARVGDRELTAANQLELKGKVSNAVYEYFHQGTRVMDVLPQFRDQVLERVLTEIVPHPRTKVLARVVDESERNPLVTISGVRVRIPSGSVLDVNAGSGQVVVEVPATRPALSPGFLLVEGAQGPPRGQVLRMYFHVLTPESAEQVWFRVLHKLEKLTVPYRAKALTIREAYPRMDALVVYLGAEFGAAVAEIAEELRGSTGLGVGTSPFTRAVAPGISLAWEPDDPRSGARKQSFGEHRAAAFVEGIFAYASLAGEGTPEAAVAAAFTTAGCDPAAPERNTSSPMTSQDVPGKS